MANDTLSRTQMCKYQKKDELVFLYDTVNDTNQINMINHFPNLSEIYDDKNNCEMTFAL